MDLEFKPNFELARQRWAQFWHGESTHPLLWAVRPKPGVEPVPKPGCYVCAFNDIEPVIEQAIGWAVTHEFLDGAIPGYQVTFGCKGPIAIGPYTRSSSGHPDNA